MADQSTKKTTVVSRKRGRPADTDSTDTRDRIVVCARERFAAEGFEGTTNREIAETAKVSSAALYHYFPSKVDIYIAVCESITEIFVEVFARVKATETTLEGRLVALFTEVGTLGASAPSTVGFITGISAVVQKHPEVSKGTDVFGKEFGRNIVDLIATAEETDRILQGTTVQSFADLVSSVLAGLGRMSARGDQSRHVAVAASFLRLIHTAAQK
jgi:AcrR family transcriptional regulator